jgi:hypothetical protein
MMIRLSPELEALIAKDRGARLISAADEFVIQAVQLLHEQEQWLADNGRDIAAKIEQGFSRP